MLPVYFPLPLLCILLEFFSLPVLYIAPLHVIFPLLLQLIICYFLYYVHFSLPYFRPVDLNVPPSDKWW